MMEQNLWYKIEYLEVRNIGPRETKIGQTDRAMDKREVVGPISRV